MIGPYNPNEYYVGPRWLPKPIRKWLSKDFNLPAYHHDLNYEGRMARAKADWIFFVECLEEARDDPWLERKAYCYYVACRLFGWLSKRRRIR